jgi:hypothetical protein
MDILRFKPRGYFILDNAAGNATDLSGYSVGSTIDSTTRGTSLTSNAVLSTYGKRTDGASGLTFAEELWLRGNEWLPRSLAVTLFPILPNSANKVTILAPTADDEGLWMQGTKLYFGTRFLNTGIAQCEYDFEFARRLVVLAVHTPVKNSLYVNGELVSEVDITFDQIADVYKNTTANVSLAGGSTTTSTALFNEIAFFESALDGKAAKIIYDDQTRGFTGDIPAMFGGEKFGFSTDFRKPALAYSWKDAGDWDRAMKTNCITDEDLLLPETRAGVAVDAQWLTSVNMYNGSATINVNEINVDYTGSGCTVSISLDGMNWTIANGSVPQNFNPFHQDLYVKVDFVAGTVGAFLDNLTINAYTTNTIPTKGGRTITYNTPTSVFREYPPQQFHDKWGVDIDTGGSITISNATNNPATFATWFKPDVAVTLATAFNYGAGQYYLNGVAVGATTLSAGQWYLVHFVPTAATITTNPVPLTATGTYGLAAFYKTKLSATQISNIYREYNGPIVTTNSDSTALAVTQSATPALIYATDYAVIAGSE